MVNIIDSKGKLSIGTTSKASLRVLRSIEIINKSSLDFIKGSKDLIRLQEIKDILKKEQVELKKPYGMWIIKGHANAQVRSDCLNMRAHDKIQAKLYGTRGVVFYNHKLIQEVIAQEKDVKVKAEMSERYKILQSLPRKESYY